MAATTKTWSNNNPPQCEDDDLNGFKSENNNLIVGSGQALSTSDNQQTQKAVSVYAAGGAFYTDGGAADAYALTAIGTKVAPPAYFAGMEVKFVPSNTNTGASTVNVATLGVKNLKDANGLVLTANALQTTKVYTARYDLSAGEFRLDYALSVVGDYIYDLYSLTTFTGVISVRRKWLCPRSGSYRFRVHINTGGISITVTARVYRNGVAVGTLRSITGTFQTSDTDEDLGGFQEGDTIEIWSSNSASAGSSEDLAFEIQHETPGLIGAI